MFIVHILMNTEIEGMAIGNENPHGATHWQQIVVDCFFRLFRHSL